MATKFRELVAPGSNYEFVGKARMFFTISVLAVIASLAMLPINNAVRGSMLNWTIDFKGGTEMIVGLDKPVPVGEVRNALSAGGFGSADVSAFTFSEQGQQKQGYLVRLPQFGAVPDADASKMAEQFVNQFGGNQVVAKAKWSGDTFFVRATRPITQAEFGEFLKSQGQEMKPWTPDQEKEFLTPLAGTNEYNYQVSVFGLDRKVEQALDAKVGADASIKQVDAVGAKAGTELRNNAILSLLYALGLILLYIAFRFDMRFGPGAVLALFHDAIIVVGVFAVTWTEFSLTTVAAVLTVIGYSINDTIVIFDRIRENEHKLKDKKLDRVINISVNETLTRSLLTAGTTLVVTLAMNLLGTGLVKNFAFAMNIGVIVGTYSSVFIASPVMLWLNQKYFSKRPSTGRRPAEAES